MHTWYVYRRKGRASIVYYAQTNVGRPMTVLQLHRYLWPDFLVGRPIDHRNRNGKDNRRANLDDGGDGRNQNNQGVQSNNKGYLTGVSRQKTGWTAQIGKSRTGGFRRKYFPDARHGGREQAYTAACAQRTLWAEEAGNRNGLEPR